MVTSRRYLVLALGATACGSVSHADPSLWDQTKDLTGTQFQVPPPGSAGGAAGDTAGAPNAAGAGGQVVVPQGGAAGAIQPGAGGSAPGAGGVQPNGAGGFNPGAGGTMMGDGGSSPGAGGADPGAGGMISGNSGPCTMTFDVTTVTANGFYAPLNAGAVWISDPQSKFVKTLRTWSRKEMKQVTAWTQATGSNTVDAVTGATRLTHGPLDQTKWDCTDVMHAAVPDGQYVAHVTFAEQDPNPFFPSAPIQASVTFTKSPAGSDVMGTDTANFKGLHVKLTIP